jgi:hypothetical protein
MVTSIDIPTGTTNKKRWNLILRRFHQYKPGLIPISRKVSVCSEMLFFFFFFVLCEKLVSLDTHTQK